MPFVSKKTIEEWKTAAAELQKSLEAIQDAAILTSIERSGRENTFTFIRNGEQYQIVTMGLIGDNLPEWKEKLLR